jgi:hypothetical protein
MFDFGKRKITAMNYVEIELTESVDLLIKSAKGG